MKVCTGCGQEKSLDQFNRSKSTRDGLNNKCKVCARAVMKNWELRHPEGLRERKSRGRNKRRAANPGLFLAKSLFVGARSRSISQKLPFDLTEKWILERILVGFCPVTGIPFNFDKRGPFLPSVDQILPAAGYTKSNSQVVVWVYNAAKQHWGHEVVVELAKSLTDQKLPKPATPA